MTEGKLGEEGLADVLAGLGVEEVCPNAADLNEETVAAWHGGGFTIRAWGVANEAEMRRLVSLGVDGMTVNFPEKLTSLLE